MSNEELKERLANMAAMFDMYSTKRYTKPVELWAAAVCRYLSSAYPSVTTSVLRLLVEVSDVLRLLVEVISLLVCHVRDCTVWNCCCVDVRERSSTLSQVSTKVDI